MNTSSLDLPEAIDSNSQFANIAGYILYIHYIYIYNIYIFDVLYIYIPIMYYIYIYISFHSQQAWGSVGAQPATLEADEEPLPFNVQNLQNVSAQDGATVGTWPPMGFCWCHGGYMILYDMGMHQNLSCHICVYDCICISVIPYFGDIHANLLAILMVSRVPGYA